jgi:hypothetical protein
MKKCYSIIITLLLTLCTLHAVESEKHLFILTGQSNMVRLDPTVSFTPGVKAALGKENVIVVHHAKGGEPIAKWYKQATAAGVKASQVGEIYDELMVKVNDAIKGKELLSVSFIWMQGERDANSKVMNGDKYAKYLEGLIQQLSTDMGRDDINVVIGRISDFGTKHPSGMKKYADWAKVREAQVTVAESNPRYTWVDTDDLNDEGSKANDLHYFPATYKILGQRFADKAIELIRK